VIQRRDDFGEPRENFNRDWADYKNGFGDPAKEFWMGNENIYMLTNNEDYALRIELEDFEGNKRSIPSLRPHTRDLVYDIFLFLLVIIDTQICPIFTLQNSLRSRLLQT
jgi:Fibrinogen beta and gamma chains, C-terminal globular domain